MHRRLLPLAMLTAALIALPTVLHAQEAAQEATDEPGDIAAVSCLAGFRAFDHEFLATESVCIPNEPQRIAIADFAVFDVMYTLDIPAAAVSNLLIYGWYGNMVPELIPSITAYLRDAPDIGGIPINLEAVLAADPDLILVNGLLVPDEAVYEQFSAIAPTVVKNETNVDDWREYMRFYGEALNVADEVETLLSDYEARLETLRADSDGAWEGATASLLQMNDPATIYVNHPNYRGWQPMLDVGFIGSEAQSALMSDDNTPNFQLSQEEIGLLDTDYVFIMNSAFDPATQADNTALYESYTSDPLWSLLPAVQNNRLYLVDLAWQANGLISAHAVIDDMYRLLLNTEPTTPNPYAAGVTAESTPEATALP